MGRGGYHSCFTCHNLSELDAYKDLSWDDLSAKFNLTYLIFQWERCPNTGRDHYQGYCQFSSRVGLKHLKGFLATAHWEWAKGTPSDNRKYCSKPESRVKGPVEFGTYRATIGEQGKRTDIHKAKEKIMSGEVKSEEEALIDDETCGVLAKYPRYAAKLFELRIKHDGAFRGSLPTVIVLWGETGTGKTSLAIDITGDIGYLKSAESKWWDGYITGQPIILDELRGEDIGISYLLRVLNGIVSRVETKGGHVLVNSTFIVITSNEPPRGWYPLGRGRDVAALERRITHIFQVRRRGDDNESEVLHEDWKGEAIEAEWRLPEGFIPRYSSVVEEKKDVVDLTADDSDTDSKHASVDSGAVSLPVADAIPEVQPGIDLVEESQFIPEGSKPVESDSDIPDTIPLSQLGEGVAPITPHDDSYDSHPWLDMEASVDKDPYRCVFIPNSP